MKDNIQHGEYLAPEVKVIEIKSQGVLCASGQLQEYDDGTWTW